MKEQELLEELERESPGIPLWVIRRALEIALREVSLNRGRPLRGCSPSCGRRPFRGDPPRGSILGRRPGRGPQVPEFDRTG